MKMRMNLDEIFLFVIWQPHSQFWATFELAVSPGHLKVTSGTEAQIKTFFIFKKSCFQIFCHFNHPMIYYMCDIMMSIST